MNQRDAIQTVREALALKRNTSIHDNPEFVGEWVAIPREDFLKCRESGMTALDTLEREFQDKWQRMCDSYQEQINRRERELATLREERDKLADEVMGWEKKYRDSAHALTTTTARLAQVEGALLALGARRVGWACEKGEAMRIAKTFRFEAAHRLEGWPKDHKCHNLHGHSYKVEIVVRGPVLKSTTHPGAVIDFAELSDWWRSTVFPSIDHQILNNVMNEPNTTAENISAWLAERFNSYTFKNKGISLSNIRVWETEDSWAEYIP